MLGYLLRRLPPALLTVVLSSVVIFGCIRLLPGDPAGALLGPDATPQALETLRQRMGLNEPVLTQYADWVGGVFRGNLGTSLITGSPIREQLAGGLVPTLQLAFAGMLVTIVVAAFLGISSALARGRSTRGLLHAVSTLLYGTPEYIFAVLSVMVFAVGLDLLPAGGRGSFSRDPSIAIQYLILPAVSLGLHSGAVVGRFLESSLTRTMSEDYIDAARAKGISTRQLVWRHALPNSLPSVLVVLGTRLAHLLGGTVVIEAIFTWHGLGQILVDAVNTRDYRIVQDLVLFCVAIFVVVQILTDLAQAALDPRVRAAVTAGAIG